jgi:hypothetical protein
MRAIPSWLILVTLSAAPWLMAPPGNGCPVCLHRPKDIPTYVSLGHNARSAYELQVRQDGHHYVDVVVTSGEADLDIEALDDGIADLSCQRGARYLSCTFVGEVGDDVAVTMRTTTNTARVAITSDLVVGGDTL